MRVAVIDGDLLSRRGAKSVFDQSALVRFSTIHTPEEALELPPDTWRGYDWLVVDVHDEAKEARESGTDVYPGITLIARVRGLGVDVRILAITPTTANPLLAERLIWSGVDYVYERWHFQDSGDLVDALLNPSDEHRPRRHPPHILLEEGVGRYADPNKAVEVFMKSPLYGQVQPGLTQAAIGPRRAAMALRDEVVRTGFVGTGPSPRWNEVRDYLLKLTGRLPVEARLPPI